jgi:hypothetical protein
MGWNHIILEGFCARKWDYHKCCDPHIYGWSGNEDPEKRGTLPNPDYDPSVTCPPRPEFCKKRICYECYNNDCEFLAIGKGRWKDIFYFVKHTIKRKNKTKRRTKKGRK